MAEASLSKPKLWLGVLLWLACLGVACVPAVIVAFVDAPRGPLAGPTRGFAALSLTAAAIQLVTGALLLRGRSLPGAVVWAPALAPWLFTSALGAWTSFANSHWALFRFETLLWRAAYSSGGLLLAGGVASALTLLGRAQRSEARASIATRAALGFAVVAGSFPVGAMLWRALASGSIHDYDSVVFFLPASIPLAFLVAALRTRPALREGEPSLVFAFALSLGAPLLLLYASVLGVLQTLDGEELEVVGLPRAIFELRFRGAALSGGIVAVVVYVWALRPTLRGLRSAAVERLAGIVVFAAGTAASILLAWRLNAHLGTELGSTSRGRLRSPFSLAVSRTPIDPRWLEKPVPRPNYPYALPLEPEDVERGVPTDADLQMAAAEEAPPQVPELAPGLPEPVPRWDRECSEGNGKSCVNLARIVEDFDIGRAPLVLAAALLDKGCRGGSAHACGRLGQYQLRARGVREDSRRGAELLEDACKRGSEDACARLGTELAWGHFLPPDGDRAEKLLEHACEKQVWHACALRARQTTSHFLSQLERNTWDERARKAARSSCEAGDLESCAFLDYSTPAYFPGGRVLFDFVSEWWRRYGCEENLPLSCEAARLTRDPLVACRKGIGSACESELVPASVLEAGCRTGSLVACGAWVKSAKPDSPERLRRRGAACDAGHPRYCAAGVGATSAENVKKLESACLGVWLSRSEEEFDGSACSLAGHAYQAGSVVPRNIGRALELYRRGCWKSPRYPDHGACVAMAEIFLSGDGVARDFSRAMQIFASDCEVDGKISCGKVAELLERTAPDGESEERKRWREHYRSRSQ